MLLYLYVEPDFRWKIRLDIRCPALPDIRPDFLPDIRHNIKNNRKLWPASNFVRPDLWMFFFSNFKGTILVAKNICNVLMKNNKLSRSHLIDLPDIRPWNPVSGRIPDLKKGRIIRPDIRKSTKMFMWKNNLFWLVISTFGGSDPDQRSGPGQNFRIWIRQKGPDPNDTGSPTLQNAYGCIYFVRCPS
jgi:hypothetical protein